MTRLVVCAALGIEARALSQDGDLNVVRIGMGPAKARSAAGHLPEFEALAIVGCGGALDDRLRPGDLFVATEVRGASGTVRCRSAEPSPACWNAPPARPSTGGRSSRWTTW